ncbi:phosphatase PAP2 family protein [Micromonospora sp. STR1s_5]|nr:phosphatase PAP2 family protein [Micromonospora sp. STR1s_5]
MALRAIALAVGTVCFATPTLGDVITDWNEIANALVRLPPPQAHRAVAMVHLAMFDAVNSIEPTFSPYLVQLPSERSVSKEAAAAAAASTVLAALLPTSEEVADRRRTYLATIKDVDGKDKGVRLGEAVAQALLAARKTDGADAPDDYRPRTSPGVYVGTTWLVGPNWGRVKPFTMASPSQFRPAPPPDLSSEQWATDVNEIKRLGSRDSKERSRSQTEDAQFWLRTGPQAYDPIVRQIVAAKNLSVVECARFMALTSAAMADALIAVLDAKYHYEFWRPVTAIRNGDLHGNPAVTRDASWQPLDVTPLHPEYPCAHCIVAAALAGVVETLLGSGEIPQVRLTSPTAPGVSRQWTSVRAIVDQVSAARIWAGFHYRFSTRAAEDMGWQLGRQAVRETTIPRTTAAR